jgi:hypothetical protein
MRLRTHESCPGADEYAVGRDKLVSAGVIEMHECGCMFMWKSASPDGELPGTD